MKKTIGFLAIFLSVIFSYSQGHLACGNTTPSGISINIDTNSILNADGIRVTRVFNTSSSSIFIHSVSEGTNISHNTIDDGAGLGIDSSADHAQLFFYTDTLGGAVFDVRKKDSYNQPAATVMGANADLTHLSGFIAKSDSAQWFYILPTGDTVVQTLPSNYGALGWCLHTLGNGYTYWAVCGGTGLHGLQFNITESDFVGNSYSNSFLIGLQGDVNYRVDTNGGSGTKLSANRNYTYSSVTGMITLYPYKYTITIL